MQEQDLGLIKRSVNGILSNFDYERKELEQRFLKDLRAVVRKNETIIEDFVNKLFEELNKSNADRRFGTMLICDYFFQRSHKFRTELLNHVQDLILFTIETDPLHYPLPGPPKAAITLKKESLKIIKAWIDKFSNGYPKLATASQFLAECKNFDFIQLNEQLLAERRRAEEERIKQAAHAEKVGKKIQKHLDESKIDIERSLTECRTSIRLIFPDLFLDDNDEANMPSTSSSDRIKLHGYKANETLSIVINTDKINIEETENNTPLVDALRDSQVDLNKHLKSVRKWLKKLIEVGAASNPTLLKRLVEYKAQIVHELQRCQQLKIKRKKTDGSNSDDSGDSDFEDVVKEDLELEFPTVELFGNDNVPDDIMRKIKQMENTVRNEDDEMEAGPSGLNQPSTSKDVDKAASGSKIPQLSYGLDLKYWGQNVEPAMIPRNEMDGHPFWRASDPSDTYATEVADVYTSRQMSFVGERPVIKYKCRAPLPSGKLCPRMDIRNCPFHGPIVQRDDMGFPVNELGKGSLEHLKLAEERIKRHAEKEEEEYLRDVEAATGVSLSNGGNKKRRLNRNSAHGTGRKREKTQTELSRERLTKKLFNKSAIKRVTDTLTQIARNRSEKQFSSQFNYALQRK